MEGRKEASTREHEIQIRKVKWKSLEVQITSSHILSEGTITLRVPNYRKLTLTTHLYQSSGGEISQKNELTEKFKIKPNGYYN